MTMSTEFAAVTALDRMSALMRAAAVPALLALGLAAALPAQAGEGESYPAAGNDVRNTASLQRGARNFMNYCSGCHSAQYVRYNRIAADLHIPEDVLRANLIFNPDTKTADVIRSSLPAEDAKRWFGNAPPDLSLIARSRGTAYISAFLKGFYADPSRPTGVNNLVLKGTAMPHVLASLQGVQTAEFTTKKVTMGGVEMDQPEFEKFVPATPGSLTPAQFDDFVRDTVNFLDYIGEPGQTRRQDLGVWVILFLLVFTGFAYGMKKEYWKDVK